jgi:ribosomal protein L37E
MVSVSLLLSFSSETSLDSLLTQIPPPLERVPPPETEPETLLADVEQSTVPPPNTEPNTLLADVEHSSCEWCSSESFANEKHMASSGESQRALKVKSNEWGEKKMMQWEGREKPKWGKSRNGTS